MNTVRIGIVTLVSFCLVGCVSQPLSRSDAQRALIRLAESKGTPLALAIPGLKSGNIRCVTGKEEGISPGIWDVNLSNRISRSWWRTTEPSIRTMVSFGEYRVNGRRKSKKSRVLTPGRSVESAL